MRTSKIIRSDDCSTHFEALGSDALKHVSENRYDSFVLFAGNMDKPLPLDSNENQIKQLFDIGKNDIFDVIIYHRTNYSSVHVFTY